jgi:hypothetical protein
MAALSGAQELKVTRLSGASDAVIRGDDLAPWLAAIGGAQKPGDSCPRGVLLATLVFKDRYGTRLGSLGVFEEAGALGKEAALRDALGGRCEAVVLADAGALAELIDRAAPAGAAP